MHGIVLVDDIHTYYSIKVRTFALQILNEYSFDPFLCVTFNFLGTD